jgi:HK97 family phage portal protein
MKVRLPIIGQVLTGSDTAQEVQAIETKEKFLDVLGGMLLFSPNRLSDEKTISTKLLQANKGWVYRNNDVIAQEVSKMEFELYTVGLSGGEIVYNEITSHPLLDLLDKPNDETTKSDALYVIQSHKKLTGDAFWIKIRNGQQVVGLRSLPPDKITLNLQTPTENDPTVIQSYTYRDRIDGLEITVTYDPKDVIHFKKPNPNNAFRGLGAVEAFAETIDLDNLTTETSKKFFQNGALTNFVLTTDKSLTDEQLKRLKAEMNASYTGASNAYKTMILGGGLKPEDISYSNKDMQFLDQLEWYRDKLMIGFGNTKASLGMIDDVNRASHESSLVEWKRNTVQPDMNAIVNTLNEFLVPEFGTNLVLGYCDPVPEDRTDDVSEAQTLYAAGVMTLNEARALIDLEEIEGGETVKQPVVPNFGQGDNNAPTD